ncbi:MAG: amino acid kinase family protein, partial [Thermoanaerobaculia bacterium]
MRGQSAEGRGQKKAKGGGSALRPLPSALRTGGWSVLKFGGVAVGSAEALLLAVNHVKRSAPRVAAVVSAANGITDLLLEAGHAALRGDRVTFISNAKRFEARHVELVGQIFKGVGARSPRPLLDLISDASHEMRSMCESIAVLREFTKRAQDALVARGERMLARIFTAALNEQGIDATYVEATDVILTEHRLGSLWPNFARCERAAKKHVLPILGEGRVVVMPGFLGSGPDGEIVTLGRGGTDFSAAILARIIGADSVTLFKEVDGLMTADPKSVPSARLLSELHYREAAELAFYGAKVL